MWMHESRELRLEEVKSKVASTGGSEVMDTDALLGNVEDGSMEVVVQKDVLVEELTRSETVHEEKVCVCVCYL